MSYKTVCQFDDSMMVVCDCHCEGMLMSCDKKDKELYLQYWTIAQNSGIFSHNIHDAFYYLFHKNDITTHVVDINRDAMFEIANYINDVFKFKKKFKKESQTDNTYSLDYYINGEDYNKLYIKNNMKSENSVTFIFKTGKEYRVTEESKLKTFWKILTHGTSGVNEIVINEFEAEMFLDFLIDCLRYKW